MKKVFIFSKNFKKFSKSPYAFTLIELLVVITIIGILAALSTSAVTGVLQRGYKVQCLNNIKNIGLAMKTYAADNDGSFPTNIGTGLASTGVFAALTNGNYLSITKIYVCPSDTGKKEWGGNPNPFNSTNCSYAVVIGDSSNNALTESAGADNPLILDRVVTAQANQALTVNYSNSLWTAGEPHKTDGGNVFYVGGQIIFKKNKELVKASTGGTNGYLINP